MTNFCEQRTGCPQDESGGGRQRGFTLIEALTVVAILTFLSAMAIPSMTAMVRNGKLRGAGSDFFGDLLMARSEAVKQNCKVQVVQATSGTWTGGWSVTSTAACSAGAVVLAKHPALASDILVTLAPSAATNVTYGSNGRVSNGLQTVTFYENVSGTQARCVGVDASGVPRVTVDTDGNAANGCN